MVLAAVLAPIALHVGTSTARLLVRDLEVAVDVTAKGGGAVGYVYHGNGTAIRFEPNGDRLEGVIPPSPERPAESRLSYRFDAQSRHLSDVLLDGAPLDPARVISLPDRLPPKTLFELVIVKLPRWGAMRLVAMAGLSLTLWAGLLMLLAPVVDRRRAAGLGGALSLFTYSRAWRTHVGPRDVVAVLAVAAATLFFLVGCDAESIYHVFRAANSGVDIYQFQVNAKAQSGLVYPTFPYNPLLLELWTFFDRLWGPLFGRAPAIGGQIYLQLYLCKLVNAGLLVLTVLSLISFADEEGLLRGKARLPFYLAVLNPTLFYVAVLFVQYDTAPLYFVTLGVLLSHRFERHGLLGPLFIAVGCSMKAQNVLLFPTAMTVFLYNAAFARASLRTRLRTVAAGLFLVGMVLGLFEALHLRTGTPLQLLVSNFAQVQRVWWNVFAYTPVTYVYLTIAAVLLLLLFYLFSLRVGIASAKMIAGSLFACGAIVAVYNATHLHTPSTLLQTGAALTLLLLVEGDPLRRVLLSGATVLIVLIWGVTDAGDFGRLLPGHAPGFFTVLDKKIPYEKWVRFVSIFHTVNFAALVAYAVLFWRRARGLLGDGDGETC